MIPCVSIFPASFLRYCIFAAVLLTLNAPLAWSAGEDPAWGRLITSAAIVCNPSTHKIYAVNEGAGSVTVIDATFCHAVEPPVTVRGALGLVRSTLTVTDTQFDVLPTLSVARNRTTVDPSLVTVTWFPDSSDDHNAPPSVDVCHW